MENEVENYNMKDIIRSVLQQMVAGPRVLSPGHARRSRLNDTTREARRSVARNKVRRPLQGITLDHLQACEASLNIHVPNERPQPVTTNVEHDWTTQINVQMAEINHLVGDEMVDVQLQHTIVYQQGEFSKVEKNCLSIHYRYPNNTTLSHASMAPLYYGKCLLYNLGDLDFICSLCGASTWQIEGKSIRTSIGKKCCTLGKVKMPPLGDIPIN